MSKAHEELNKSDSSSGKGRSWLFTKGLLLLCGLMIAVYFGLKPDQQVHSEGQGAEEPNKPITAQKTDARDWPFYRGDAQLTAQSHSTLKLPLKQHWTFKTNGPVKSSAIIVNQIVYIASNDGYLYAISLLDGKLLWKRDLRFETDEAEKAGSDIVAARLKAEGAPYYFNQQVIIGAANGFLHAFDSKTGKRLWYYETYGEIASSAIGVNFNHKKHLLIGSHDNSLHCVNGQTGEKVWSYETDNYVNATPAIMSHGGKELAIIGGCDGIIHAVDIETGKAHQTIELGTYMSASALTHKNQIYVGHHGNEVVRYDLSPDVDAEKPTWVYRDKNFPFFASPARKDNMLIIGSRDKKLHAIDISTGKGIWQARTRGRIDSSPIVVNDKVITGSDDGRLYVFNLKDGKRLFDFDTGNKIASSPAVSGGFVVIGSDNGNVYCLREKQS